MNIRSIRVLIPVLILVVLAGCSPAVGDDPTGAPAATAAPQETSEPPAPSPTPAPTRPQKPAGEVAPAISTDVQLQEGIPFTPAPGSPDPTNNPQAGRDHPVVVQAIADLAKQLNLDAQEIQVVQVEEVTWSDGSLGCPKAGMVYTQALVDGMRIQLEAGGQVYDYHSGQNGPAFLCTNPQ